MFIDVLCLMLGCLGFRLIIYYLGTDGVWIFGMALRLHIEADRQEPRFAPFTVVFSESKT